MAAKRDSYTYGKCAKLSLKSDKHILMSCPKDNTFYARFDHRNKSFFLYKYIKFASYGCFGGNFQLDITMISGEQCLLTKECIGSHHFGFGKIFLLPKSKMFHQRMLDEKSVAFVVWMKQKFQGIRNSVWLNKCAANWKLMTFTVCREAWHEKLYNFPLTYFVASFPLIWTKEPFDGI